MRMMSWTCTVLALLFAVALAVAPSIACDFCAPADQIMVLQAEPPPGTQDLAAIGGDTARTPATLTYATDTSLEAAMPESSEVLLGCCWCESRPDGSGVMITAYHPANGRDSPDKG